MLLCVPYLHVVVKVHMLGCVCVCACRWADIELAFNVAALQNGAACVQSQVHALFNLPPRLCNLATISRGTGAQTICKGCLRMQPFRVFYIHGCTQRLHVQRQPMRMLVQQMFVKSQCRQHVRANGQL